MGTLVADNDAAVENRQAEIKERNYARFLKPLLWKCKNRIFMLVNVFSVLMLT